MCEILFRGKRADNGEWTYGYYCPKPYSHFPCEAAIFPSETIDRDWHGERVDPDTVGRFTGLTDRNGVKIFEGDIIKHTQVYLHGKVKSFGYVKWSTAYACWLAGGYTNGRADMFLGDQSYKLEVLGNIYDNPELLEVSRNE